MDAKRNRNTNVKETIIGFVSLSCNKLSFSCFIWLSIDRIRSYQMDLDLQDRPFLLASSRFYIDRGLLFVYVWLHRRRLRRWHNTLGV
jgi:hypothetical protein